MGTFTYYYMNPFISTKKSATYREKKTFIVFSYLQPNLNVKNTVFFVKFNIYSSFLLLTLKYVN